MVTPPTVLVPDVTDVEVAAQTVVDSVRVTVVAGIVYTPGVGQVVARGVGTTGDGELVGTMTAEDVVGTLEEAGAEVDDWGATPITWSGQHVSRSYKPQ